MSASILSKSFQAALKQFCSAFADLSQFHNTNGKLTPCDQLRCSYFSFVRQRYSHHSKIFVMANFSDIAASEIGFRYEQTLDNLMHLSQHASKAPKSSKCRYFLKISPIELKSGRDLIFCAASTILKAKIKKVNSFGALRSKSKHNTSSQKV